MRRLLFLLFTLFFFCQNTFAQKIDTSKYSTMLKGTTKESNTLFLHCDKTLYTGNEIIWFTAYLNSAINVQKHDILSAFLQLEGTNKIVQSEQYFMDSGLAFGSMELPDTIPPGNYKLIAYTNVMNANGLPNAIFTQNLTIKTTAQQKFSAEVQLLPLNKDGSTIDLQIKVKGLPIQKNGKYPTASIQYYLKDKEHLAESNAEGSFFLSLPAKDIDALHNRFYAEVKFDNEIKHLAVTLPFAHQEAVNVKFYPEGGELTNGVMSVVGIEAISNKNQPLAFKGIVYEGSLPIDTVETNETGFAKMTLEPKHGVDYSLRPFDESKYLKGTQFNFPSLKQNHPVITIEHALVNDTLSFVLKSQALAEFNLVLHNENNVYLDFKITANAKGRIVKIPLTDIPKGIASLTVLNTDGIPLAERLFFAHYQHKNTLSISTDKVEYGKREKVSLKLKLPSDALVEDGTAIVSVACVQTNRIESLKFQDIENYTYINAKLAEGAFSTNGKVYAGDEYLESVLLIKGWRKYKDNPPLESQNFTTLEFTGNMLKKGKRVDEPISFTVLRDSAFSLQTTDNSGFFKMETANLLHGYGRRLMFAVNKSNRELYTVNLTNPFKKEDSVIARLYSANDLANLKNIQNSEAFVFDNKALKLKEVVISGKRGNQDYGKSAKNECGDFVCPYGVLNCTVPGDDKAIGAYSPVIGEIYKVYHRTSVTWTLEPTIYKGCVATSKLAGTFNGIFYSREFYLNDYTDKNLPEIDNQSTIYWNHAIEINSKDTEVSFYTSDLPGNFRVVVQGMSNSGPVFTTKEIKVN